MIKKILVPLDGSPMAEAVLPLVTTLAQAEKAEVELITVLAPIAIWNAAASTIRWDAEEEAAREYVEAKARDLEKQGIKAHSNVAYGQASYAIYDAARDLKVDFIAMTTHGRSGITRFVLGSVADKLLHSSAPLLLVRPGDEKSIKHTTAADIRKVLVPLDGSELSLTAIPAAEEMARIFDARIALCGVVTTDWIAYSGMETPVLYQDVMDSMKEATQNNLEETAAAIKRRGYDVDCFVGIGGPADEIQRIATEQGAGMIVMSTHGRSGPRRWVMGSVADAVVRDTHLPCLLVRAGVMEQRLDGALGASVEEHAPVGLT